MTKVLGRKIGVGLGKESSRGTAVAASFWLPWNAFSHNEKNEVSKLDAGYGTIHRVVDGKITRLWAEGELGGPITDKAFGLLLLSMFGTVNSAAKSSPNTSVYDHTFTVQEGVQHQSLTLNTDDAIQDYRFPRCMVDELTIMYEQSKLLEFSAKLFSENGATATNTPSYSAENIFRPQDLTFKYAADAASLDAASAVTIKSAKLTFKQNVAYDWNLGSTSPTDINNTSWEVTGEITQMMEDETIKALVLAGTQKALRFDLQNTAVTIGTSANPGLKISLNQVMFDEEVKEMSVGDLTLITYTFEAQYKISESKMAEAVLTNLTTSY